VIFTIKGESYMMYQGIFDTDFDKYCEDASVLFGKTGIHSAFEALEGWPADYATNPASIVKFFREHQWPSFLEYSEHPYVSCEEIKKALKLKAACCAGCCAGFRTPATTSYRHAAEAGVRKAPRHEIAGSRPRSAVPQAQLWGFERRTCRVRASARREVERLRREKQAGGFALSAARPEKRGSSGYLLGERRICAS
jgi:hypothetical protein